MSIEQYEIRTVRPSGIDESLSRDMDRLLAESVGADMDDIPTQGLEYFLAMASDMRANVNNGVGGRLLHSGQAYARQMHVLAFDDSRLVATLAAADNASTSRGGVLGWLELRAKLDAPHEQFRASRWRWLGHCAMDSRVHDTVNNTPHGEATVIDGMIGAALAPGHPRQPSSVYPWTDERAWRRSLMNAGFGIEGVVDYDARPFGGQGPQLTLERWTAPDNAGAILQHIANKENGERVLALAGVDLGRI
jgi:hypothetical protein